MTTQSEFPRLNASLMDYTREVFSRCPKCDRRAVIRADSEWSIPWVPQNVSFVCPNCSLNHGWPASTWDSEFRSYNPETEIEPYFGYSLWATATVSQNVVGLLNLQHVDDLVSFISATDRPRPANSKWAMVNRLPRWMLLAKHRKRIILAIEHAKLRLK